jgi:hypothetical protein
MKPVRLRKEGGNYRFVCEDCGANEATIRQVNLQEALKIVLRCKLYYRDEKHKLLMLELPYDEGVGS